MLYIVIAMVVILVVAGLVITYVAYPHRGEDIPNVPWLGGAMHRAAERAPTLTEEDEAPRFDLLRR